MEGARARDCGAGQPNAKPPGGSLPRGGGRVGKQTAVGDSEAIRSELEVLEGLQTVDEDRLEGLNDGVVEIEAARQSARLAALQAEAHYESATRDLERRQLLAIGASFPTADETAKYILARLFTDGECLACGQTVLDAAADLGARLEAGRCVVCGSDVDSEEQTQPVSKRALAQAIRAVRDGREGRLAAVLPDRDEAEAI